MREITMNTKIRIAITALISGLALVAAACGEPAGPVAADSPLTPQPAGVPTTVAPTRTTAPVTPTTLPAPTTTLPAVPTTTEPAPPTTAPATTTTTAAPTTTTTVPALAGEPFDLYGYGFAAGQEVGVIGVRHDDVLNVRALPGADQPIVATLDPLARGFTATGNGWLLPGHSYWEEVEVGGFTGWVHGSYVSRLTPPREWVEDAVTAETLLELGRIVAERHAYDDGDIVSDVVLTLAPRGEHDLGEVAYDVIGLADDSTWGVRLHVFARPTDDRQAFELVRVVVTEMCDRGVSAGGLCV